MKIIQPAYNTFIILLCSFTILTHTKEIYELKADELIDSILPNLKKTKIQRAPYATTEMSSVDVIDKKSLTTSELLYVEKEAQDISADQLSLRKRKLDIKTLLETNVGPIQDAYNVDEINVQTRRFTSIQNTTSDNVLRFMESYEDPKTNFNYKVRYRVLQLMEQFIYQTKYQLPYSQLLRKKYINSVNYRLGYCFALEKDLRRQQRVIYSTLKNYLESFVTLFAHMKLYEKVVKLNVDIRDLMVFITSLDEKEKAKKDRSRKRKQKRD